MTVDDYEEGLFDPAISLEDLKDYIKHGRKIEFSYQGQSYFTGNGREGRTV